MKSRSRFVFTAVLMAVLAPLAAQAEPHCVVMKFFDATGVAVPTAEPVIAIMVGRTPLLGDSIPIAASREPGAQVPCPQSVIDDVKKRFEQACATDQRRDRAAADQKTRRDVVDKSCSDMALTLGDRLKPTP